MSSIDDRLVEDILDTPGLSTKGRQVLDLGSQMVNWIETMNIMVGTLKVMLW